MNKLWAPWRMDYIRTPKEGGCVFCDKSQTTHYKKNLVLHQGKESFIKSGGLNFDVVPCLNDNDDHINLLQHLAKKFILK